MRARHCHGRALRGRYHRQPRPIDISSFITTASITIAPDEFERVINQLSTPGPIEISGFYEDSPALTHVLFPLSTNPN